ncbi:MFS transporter, DHA2 family, lincomycin resistance protein [Anaerocolumna jejuensis DSM 15929]|uniref:MFS transporter, DHA2 family, lincomycin resistance protein n=1 Tax=Anaerocolumna jejuensis DSM 15929 TaxID=1121322 RepID=A0A1M7BUZ6_9FIRM|nr:MFS transporter [Anaerocolumna jejuensis]SHL58733.1 MFS transporter, DHA2 family, lincomycin resistance protein [Anaerocolumna jejuensis DSM 15929]
MKKNKINVKAVMAILLFGGFLSLFNETILNVALSKLMAEMGVTATTIQWLSTGYVLIVAIMVPTSAFLINTFTTKNLYLGAMTFFFAGTILAVFAINFPMLLAARMVQAIGTGLLAPIMINSALAINPREKHGFVMGLCTCVVLVGPSLGPIVSGIVLQFFSWRSLFIMLIPLTLLCIGGGAVYLTETVELTKPKIDYLSILLSSIGFALIVYGMSIIGSATSIINIAIFVAGILSLAFFCKRQLSLKQPMLDIRAFRKPYFALGAILVIIMQMVQFSMNIVLPMLFENGLNLSSLSSALILFPAVLICSIMTTVSGKIYDKIGGKSIIPLGLLIMFIFLLVLSRIQPSTSIIAIAIINTLVYLGISLAWSPDQSNALKQLEAENQTHGVAIINTFIQLGSALGTPLFVGLMTTGQNNYLKYAASPNEPGTKLHSLYNGFSHSITVAAIIIAIAFIFSLTLRIKLKNHK